MKPFIVKIQASVATTAGQRQVLVYNEDRSVQFQCPLQPDVESLLRGRLKMYAYATLDGTILEIGNEAPGQVW